MKRLETLALCIAKFSGGFDPEFPAFKSCNPGALKTFTVKRFMPSGEGGLRSFKSWTAGMEALVFDLKTKCSGNSRSRFKPDSKLADLLAVWGMKVTRKPILYIRRGTGDNSVGNLTPL